MNDTIVVFDRIRENLKMARRDSLTNVINLSINQTLSRTVLTSGLTLLTALALWLFGGDVLNGFSFALVMGIIVGTYSSIFVASPILVFWQNFRGKGGSAVAAPTAPSQPAGRSRKAMRGQCARNLGLRFCPRSKRSTLAFAPIHWVLATPGFICRRGSCG